MLCDHNADVNLKTTAGISALWVACEKGHTDIVKLLISKGARVDDVDYKDVTSLMEATNNGHFEVVSLLLEHNADVNLRGRKGETALKKAIVKDRQSIVSLLISKGATFNSDDLLKAIKDQDITLLETAIINGSDITSVIEPLGALMKKHPLKCKNLVPAVLEAYRRDPPGFIVANWLDDTSFSDAPPPSSISEFLVPETPTKTEIDLLDEGNLQKAMIKLAGYIDQSPNNKPVKDIVQKEFILKSAELLRVNIDRIQSFIEILKIYLRCKRFQAPKTENYKLKEEFFFLFREISQHLNEIESWRDKYGLTLLMKMVISAIHDTWIQRNMELLVAEIIKRGHFSDSFINYQAD